MFLPSLKSYKYVKYKRSDTKRWSQIFLCEFLNCDKSFKKWHNLFDHLRSHAQERPYNCPVNGCKHTFSQKSNLNKHMKAHKNKNYHQCAECKETLTRTKLFQHYMQHKFEEFESDIEDDFDENSQESDLSDDQKTSEA